MRCRQRGNRMKPPRLCERTGTRAAARVRTVAKRTSSLGRIGAAGESQRPYLGRTDSRYTIYQHPKQVAYTCTAEGGFESRAWAGNCDKIPLAVSTSRRGMSMPGEWSTKK